MSGAASELGAREITIVASLALHGVVAMGALSVAHDKKAPAHDSSDRRRKREADERSRIAEATPPKPRPRRNRSRLPGHAPEPVAPAPIESTRRGSSTR